MKTEELKTADEMALRAAKVNWPTTIEELTEIVTTLTQRDHDYGTCVYAMSIAATATFHFVASEIGVSGFQASAADLDVLRRLRNMEEGFMVVDFNQLLYPQYRSEWRERGLDYDYWLAKKCVELEPKAVAGLAEANAAEGVLRHWERIVEMAAAAPKEVQA